MGVPQAAGDQATFDAAVSPATVDIAVVLDKLTITSNYTGTITVNTSLKIGAANVTSSMANGILSGEGMEIAAGTFNWTGGTFQNVTTQMIVDSGAKMTITGVRDKTLDSVYWFLFLPGSIGTWDGAGLIVFKNGSLLDNLGSFSINGSGTMQDSGGGVDQFQNHGTLNVNPGPSQLDPPHPQVTIHVGFANNNTCNIQTGWFLIDGGSTITGQTNVAPNTEFILAGNTTDSRVDALNGATITGTGMTTFNKDDVFVDATLRGDSKIGTTVSDQSVKLEGPGTLEISGSYTWFGNGPWTDTGQMKILTGGQLSLGVAGQAPYSLGRTIDNQANVTWSAARDISVTSGAKIINENNATFHIQTDNNILNGGGAGSFQNNSGALLVKDGGTATTRIDIVVFPFDGGTIKETAPGARIKFNPLIINLGFLIVSANNAGMDFSAGLEQDSGSTIASAANTATITVSGGNFVLKGGTVSASGAACGISVTGQYQQSGGTSTPGAYSTFSATDQIVESGGTIELQGGTLSATNGVQVQSGAILQGYGFVSTSTLTNSGTINPGDIGTIGTISITGNYTQTSSGILNEDITYSPPPGGATSDQLAVSGLATLSGTLNISSIGSAPSPGPTLELLTYGSRSGSWTSINLPPPPGYGHWADGFYDGGNPGYFYLSDVVP